MNTDHTTPPGFIEVTTYDTDAQWTVLLPIAGVFVVAEPGRAVRLRPLTGGTGWEVRESYEQVLAKITAACVRP